MNTHRSGINGSTKDIRPHPRKRVDPRRTVNRHASNAESTARRQANRERRSATNQSVRGVNASGYTSSGARNAAYRSTPNNGRSATQGRMPSNMHRNPQNAAPSATRCSTQRETGSLTQRPASTRSQISVNSQTSARSQQSGSRRMQSSTRTQQSSSRQTQSSSRRTQSGTRTTQGAAGSFAAAIPSSIRRYLPLIAGVAALLLLLLIFGALMRSCSGGNSAEPTAEQAEQSTTSSSLNTVATRNSETNVKSILLDEGRVTGSGEGRMSFSAVGDNLINSNLLELVSSWSGQTGSLQYDFSPLYTEVASYIQNKVDVSFINQETTLGNYQKYGYQGYPSYNTPASMADAIADAGWRFVNCNSNHTYDTWTDSIQQAQSVWNEHTSLLTIGSYSSEEDRAKVRVVECNGLRVAMLSYSYGQNGYELSDLPNDYYAVPYDEDRMIQEVSRAHEVADAVVVYLHFGTEYDNEPSNEQVALAQTCADNGVDVTLFSHSHVIEPVQWIDRASGGQMLCAYGLGDFVSGYEDYPSTVLSGMLTFDFVAQDDGSVAVENAVWHPLIEHMEDNTDTVRFVSGYTEEEAANNELLSSLSSPREWIVETTNSVIGDAVPIDM